MVLVHLLLLLGSHLLLNLELLLLELLELQVLLLLLLLLHGQLGGTPH